ncbi:MAG: cohesin domain-containing protein, partial [Actinobacteria bacterium]|nr:cohesin domain-containing protein [Actinomycetota bacterium]
MMKRVFLSFLSVAFMASLIIPAAPVHANSASVFVSPGSKSVTKGDVFTIQVRVNSGTDEMNSAQARLNFDSSKLQFQSHSVGVFNPINTSSSSSSFFLAGASLGTTYSGNQLLYQVTFKATSSGSAALSISEAQVANAGTALSVSSSGGSVSIANPPTTDDTKDDSSSGG